MLVLELLFLFCEIQYPFINGEEPYNKSLRKTTNNTKPTNSIHIHKHIYAFQVRTKRTNEIVRQTQSNRVYIENRIANNCNIDGKQKLKTIQCMKKEHIQAHTRQFSI